MASRAAAIDQTLAMQRSGLPYVGGLPVGAAAGVGAPISGALIHQQQIQFWQSQFPPPDAIERYEAVLPGTFDRIIKMAEHNQASQIEGMNRAREYTRDDTRRGHWLGFAVTATAVLGAVVCALVGAMTESSGAFYVAGSLVSVPVLTVAKVFVDSARAPSARDLVKIAGNDQKPTGMSADSTPNLSDTKKNS